MDGKLVKELYELRNFANDLGRDVADLFIRTGIVMGADFVIPLPTDYSQRMAPGYDLAIGSGLTVNRHWASMLGLALSMTPELVRFVQGVDYGEMSTRALTKGAVYGLVALVTRGSTQLYERRKKS